MPTKIFFIVLVLSLVYVIVVVEECVVKNSESFVSECVYSPAIKACFVRRCKSEIVVSDAAWCLDVDYVINWVFDFCPF